MRPRWRELQRNAIFIEATVERHELESSSIASAGYDRRRKVLEIEFSNGGVYRYYNVPEWLYDEFMRAESKGAFVNAYVKPAHPYLVV